MPEVYVVVEQAVAAININVPKNVLMAFSRNVIKEMTSLWMKL